MTPFTIERNNYLGQNIQGFYYADFGGVDLSNNPNFLYKLKNDPHHNWSDYKIQKAQQQFLQILIYDLPEIAKQICLNPLTVCVVPRAKADSTYRPNQLLFKATVSNAVNRLDNNFIDGTNYIVRHTNTKTTHLRKPIYGYVNDGLEPYPGISSDTCNFYRNINGRDILLIEDIYTKTINIDEDMIQSLFNRGANSVTIYAIGKTVYNHSKKVKMKFTDNALNIITAKFYKGVGRAWIVKNLKGNESVEKIVSQLNNKSKQDALITIEDFEFNKEQIINQIEKLEKSCDGIIAIGDKNFPKHRGNVKESERPIFLFYKGDIKLLDIENSNITVIGLLNPDESIEDRERKIVAEIIKQNVTVVSGLAFGCDSIAHKQALKGGKTVAVLPSPLNNIMPAKNKSLAFEIVEEGGLLITEYFDKHKSSMDLSSRYKDRDRLQALFCDAIVLAASYAQDSTKRWKIFDKKLDSGARLAMGFAKDYNITRAVMYDKKNDLNNPMFDLNRQLITEQKDITILTPKSLDEIINKVKSKNKNNNQSTAYQVNLFD